MCLVVGVVVVVIVVVMVVFVVRAMEVVVVVMVAVGVAGVILEGRNFPWSIYGVSVGGGMPSAFPDREGWDLFVQKCACVAILTLVPSIPAPSPFRCRPSLNRWGFSLNAQ